MKCWTMFYSNFDLEFRDCSFAIQVWLVWFSGIIYVCLGSYIYETAGFRSTNTSL